MKNILNTIHPKRLFLIDSIGALVSALMLGVVLVHFESVFGMPKPTLYTLAGIAIIFAIYSFLCFWRFPKNNWQILMKIIAITNLLYCCLTASLAIYHHQKLGLLGITYFLFELLIVVILANIELKTAQ